MFATVGLLSPNKVGLLSPNKGTRISSLLLEDHCSDSYPDFTGIPVIRAITSMIWPA